MLPTGTVTFLFTDIQGSTQLWDSFPEEMRAALAAHDEIVAATVAEQHGHMVKHTGDGAFAAFGSALDAVHAAVAVQQALAGKEWDPAIGSLEVRMALHTDVVEPEGDDYHGPAINRVARIEAAGHGGQILLSDATATLVARSLPAELTTQSLGTHLLRGLSSPERIHQLTVPGLAGSFPPLRTLTTTTAKLPTFASSFVGRGAEIAEIATLAADSDCRLLSLVGPGGAGKTRLAVETARRVAEDQRIVAHFVSLVPVSTVDGLVKAIAESLDYTIDLHLISQTFTEKRQVFDRLAMYPVVLVLDNFEHLVPHAGFVAELIDEVPAAIVLVTSRERLGLQAEWVRPVGGLAGTDHEGATLFVERARQAGATVETNEAVDRICELVGGLPLAIELAAAWAPVLPPAEIAGEIAANLGFLSAMASDVPERHRSLRAVFDYSWSLLDDAGRDALAGLGVFPSSFTRQAADEITGTGLAALTDLLNKSLVQRTGVDRFELHAMVREFALERLGERRAELAAAHARHYADLLLARSDDLAGSANLVGVRDEVAEELDHVRVAAEWHLRHRDATECVPILETLRSFYFLYSWSEGADTMERLAEIRAGRVAGDPRDDVAYLAAKTCALALAQTFREPAPVSEELHRLLPAWEREGGEGLAWCLTLLGDTACMSGDLAAALDWFHRAENLDVARSPELNTTLHAWHGWTLILTGDIQGGHAMFAAGEALARESQAELGRAYLLSKLGVSSDELGDHAAAADYHGRAQDVFVKFNDPSGQGYALSRLSWTWFLEGDHELAIRYALEGLEQFDSVNHRWGVIISRCRAALPEIELGRIDSALERLHEALDMAERVDMKEAMMYALTGIGRAWAASGDDERAALLLAFAARGENPYHQFAEPALEAVSARLGEAAMAPLRERAAGVDLGEAVALARS